MLATAFCRRSMPQSGTSASITRNHMEVRGIGIIDVGMMFGVKSIRREKQLDLVVFLQDWDEVEEIDRLGMEENTTEVLKRSLLRRITSFMKEISTDVVSVLGDIMRCKDST